MQHLVQNIRKHYWEHRIDAYSHGSYLTLNSNEIPKSALTLCDFESQKKYWKQRIIEHETTIQSCFKLSALIPSSAFDMMNADDIDDIMTAIRANHVELILLMEELHL